MESVKSEPKVLESVSNRVGYVVLVLIPVALLVCPLLIDLKLVDESTEAPAKDAIEGKSSIKKAAQRPGNQKKVSKEARGVDSGSYSSSYSGGDSRSDSGSDSSSDPGSDSVADLADIPAPSPQREDAVAQSSDSEQFDELVGRGVSSLNVGDYEKAERCFRQAYSIAGFLGNDDPRKIKLFELIGRTYLARKSYSQAIQFLRYVRYCQDKRFGKDSRESAYIRSLLSRAYQGLGRKTQSGDGD